MGLKQQREKYNGVDETEKDGKRLFRGRRVQTYVGEMLYSIYSGGIIHI